MPIIEAGSPAPDFTLPDQSGRARSLKDFRGKMLVLFFYPKDDTPGCTDEACQFRDLLPRFESGEAAIVGISPDDASSHAAFASKFDLNFTLLADAPPPKKEGGVPPVCNAYGVWREKTMYGRKYMGVVRTTFLIDAEGRVARRWDNVKVPGHAEQVLHAIKHTNQHVG